MNDILYLTIFIVAAVLYIAGLNKMLKKKPRKDT